MSGRWSLVVYLVLNCSVGLVRQQCDSAYWLSLVPQMPPLPPRTVVIPEGGGTSLFCQHDSRVVDWYKEDTAITDDNRGDCGCTIVTAASIQRNLTFTNFMSENSGRYGCWVNRGSAFDECNFNVIVAVVPEVMLDQSTDVSGNQLRSDLRITPTLVLGLPEATIIWSRNDQPLDPTDPRVAIFPDGSLTVTDVQASDRGVYTIRASNSAAPDGVNASVNVFINFVEVVGPTFGDGGLLVECVATGYPTVTATLTPDTGRQQMTNNVNSDSNFHIVRTVGLTFLTCNPATTYTCEAMSGSSGSSQSISTNGMPPCDVFPSPPTNIQVQRLPNSFTEAMVSWVPPPPGITVAGYRVMYNDQTVEVIGGDSTTVTLRDLMSEVAYDISVASLRFAGDTDSSFSTPLVVLPPIPCNANELMSKVVGVQANLANVNGQRTLSLNWSASMESGVVGYRVGVVCTASTDATDVQFIATTREFTLPPEYCNGSTYRFTVVPMDVCGRSGPGQSVSGQCSSIGDNEVTFSVSEREPTSLQLAIASLQPISQSMPLFINATTLKPPDNGTVFIYTYTLDNLPADGSICIGGLKVETFYNVCLSVTGNKVCRQEATAAASSSSGGMGGDTCLIPTIIEIQRPGASTVDFPDWAIAVIVVGVFAMVALLFCFIGLCFACNTNSKGEYDTSSVSSLQTASIPPGPSPYMTNHRINQPSSPHRSCLSYHKQGHSTNWNEHRDTLRQMETDGGTHV